MTVVGSHVDGCSRVRGFVRRGRWCAKPARAPRETRPAFWTTAAGDLRACADAGCARGGSEGVLRPVPRAGRPAVETVRATGADAILARTQAGISTARSVSRRAPPRRGLAQSWSRRRTRRGGVGISPVTDIAICYCRTDSHDFLVYRGYARSGAGAEAERGVQGGGSAVEADAAGRSCAPVWADLARACRALTVLGK